MRTCGTRLRCPPLSVQAAVRFDAVCALDDDVVAVPEPRAREVFTGGVGSHELADGGVVDAPTGVDVHVQNATTQGYFLDPRLLMCFS